MFDIKMEHILMLIIVAFVLYKFMSRCSYINSFSVDGQESNTNCDIPCYGLTYSDKDHNGSNVCEFNECSASNIYTSIENFGCSNNPNGFIDNCCNLQKCNKLTCNNDKDCNGHHNICNDGLCQCKNDKFNFNATPPCSECNHTYLNPDKNCKKCRKKNGIDGKLLDPKENCKDCLYGFDINSSCTKCINNDLDINSSCTKCTNAPYTGRPRDNLVIPDCIKCANENMDADRNCEFINCNNIINENTCNNNTNDYCAWEDEKCKVKKSKPCGFSGGQLQCKKGFKCDCNQPSNCMYENKICIKMIDFIY